MGAAAAIDPPELIAASGIHPNGIGEWPMKLLCICNTKNTDRAIQSKVLTVFTLFSVLREFNFLRQTTVFFSPLATCSVSKYSSQVSVQTQLLITAGITQM